VPPESQQPDPWSLRASDADRDKYLGLLREAYAEGRLDAVEYEERMEQALGAKTYRELYPVLNDLPIDPSRVPGPPIAPSSQIVPANHAPGADHYQPVAAPRATGAPAGYVPENSVVSIFGSASRKGPWLVPPELTVLSVFGDATIDLTGAILSGMTTELRCNAVFGSIKVIVPDALHVDVSGVGILGEYETKDKRKGQDKRRMPAPNAPQIRLSGTALFGTVDVRIVVPRPGATVSMLNPALPPAPQPPAIEQPPDSG
jgi:hypothetical protein